MLFINLKTRFKNYLFLWTWKSFQPFQYDKIFSKIHKSQFLLIFGDETSSGAKKKD